MEVVCIINNTLSRQVVDLFYLFKSLLTCSNHAYRPGVGYAFSEYASDGGMLMFADPVLHSGPWYMRTIYETGDAGRFISLAWLLNGRLAGTFYQYDAVSLGTILYMVLLEEFEEEIVRVVADSIGTSQMMVFM
ncbi:MAG: hypothetical protein GTO29_08170 [Candidatus Latescibacteria bacterium]|nr:hypothetical protein [Candidatus Latescibacterota bacterium]